MEWWRSWHGAPTDPKWLLIARRAKVAPGMVSAIVWALLDYASQAKDRGCVAGFDVETYAAFSGFEDEQIAAVLTAMRSKDIIGPDNRLTSWDKRQPQREDNSTPRVQAYRERQRNTEERSETPSNTTPSLSPLHPSLFPNTSAFQEEKREDSEQNRAEQSRTERKLGATPRNAVKRSETQAAAATSPTTALAVKAFENTIGVLPGGTVREEMISVIDDLAQIEHSEWWQQALDEAITHNARSWAYVRKILTRCIAEGRAPASGLPGSNGSKPQGREHPGITAMHMIQAEREKERAEHDNRE